MGLALSFGGGVLLVAAPSATAAPQPPGTAVSALEPTSGPCRTPGVAGIAVAHQNGASVECATGGGTEVTSQSAAFDAYFTIARKID